MVLRPALCTLRFAICHFPFAMPGVRVRRILKALAWAGAAGVALALLAGLWVRWAFPPERLRQLTVARLEAALRRPVQIEELSFNLLRGIEARGVQVGPSRSEERRVGKE